MAKINIILAGNNFLLNRGMMSLIDGIKDFSLACEVKDERELFEGLALNKANVVVLDLSTIAFKPEVIQQIKVINPSVQILALNQNQPRQTIARILEQGVTSYLMLHCDREEITEAIYKTAKGERFLCGQVVEVLISSNTNKTNYPSSCPLYSYCGGVTISEREIEIIRCVAEGYSNQEIADKLFLSVHTVTTHRKNIMSKLGVNNTAGLVMYAVREQLISPN
jgi:DNA-binding NarL/FixJ family response regulator